MGFDGPELKKEAEKLASSAGGLTEEQLFAAEDLALSKKRHTPYPRTRSLA